jgi:DNA-binding GntR family transcriptional regulator
MKFQSASEKPQKQKDRDPAMDTPINDKKRTQVDQIFKRLRSEIVEGTLKPKEKIFEEDLAKRFNISRSPVREAFRILESEGLIRIVPRRGAYVSDIDEVDIEQILASGWLAGI